MLKRHPTHHNARRLGARATGIQRLSQPDLELSLLQRGILQNLPLGLFRNRALHINTSFQRTVFGFSQYMVYSIIRSYHYYRKNASNKIFSLDTRRPSC